MEELMAGEAECKELEIEATPPSWDFDGIWGREVEIATSVGAGTCVDALDKF
jgi:hypothetical protein